MLLSSIGELELGSVMVFFFLYSSFKSKFRRGAQSKSHTSMLCKLKLILNRKKNGKIYSSVQIPTTLYYYSAICVEMMMLYEICRAL